MEKGKEEHAIVLDYLPNGYPFDNQPGHRKVPIVQAVGKEHFVLLELVPKKDIKQLQSHDEIYIGEGKRDHIHHIIGKVSLSKLTATAKAELQYVIVELIKKNEKKFLDFFNKAQPLTTRMHQIELLPGVGKKHMWQIIEERKNKEFESFADLKKRVKLLPDPEKSIVRRIMLELEGKEKHMVFVDN